LPDRRPEKKVSCRLQVTVLLLGIIAHAASAQQRFDIAVIDDGPNDRLSDRHAIYVGELLTLTRDEFDVRIHSYSGDWSQQSIETVIEEAYSNPQIDMLMVIGFVANQIATMRTAFPKPTFLPVLLDAGHLVTPSVDRTSGITNLNYLTVYSKFSEDLDAMGELVQFKKLVLLMDEEFSAAIPDLKTEAIAVCAARGIELVEVTHDGRNHDLMSRVPADTEAIFVAGLPRMPADAYQSLISSINAAGIPSYSFVGTEDVKRGLLMTSSESRDVNRQARMNALNMQAVMLGGRAEEQPVSTVSRKRYTINMETARQLGVSPSFDVLNAATLLNERPTITGRQFGLLDIAAEAVALNQDLLAQGYATRAGFEQIGIARSSLLPQVGLNATADRRDVSPLVEAGFFAERRTDGAIGLEQLIYSDSAAANVTIQKQLQLAREAVLHETRLDIIEAASSAYYSVLNARSQLMVQEHNLVVTRRNLHLAQSRVELGSSSSADVYRWQAEEARAQILVLDARASLYQSWNRLNRLLHRPQFERIALQKASFDEPFVFTRNEFELLVSSPADYARFSQFFVNRGLSQAPELLQVDAQLAAKRREWTSQKRAFWLPDFNLSGRYTSNFSQSTAGAGVPFDVVKDDWTVGLQATLPLFTSGQRRADVSRASLEVRQLETLRISVAEKVEESIRIQLHFAQAAYGQIDLSAIAAASSRKNYELVADAYARGTVSIIKLLDAQEASLNANAATFDSLYNFLITIMSLQRAVGGFDFLLPESERIALANSMRDYLKRSSK
jgi:outer membrane protein